MPALVKFKIDLRELNQLADNFKFRSKGVFFAVIRNTLDNQAFATMKTARNRILPSVFHIRNKWIQSSVIVEKAKRNQSPLLMFSLVGAAARWGRNSGKRFMGLREQQFGIDEIKPEIPALVSSRGGSIAKKVKPSRRYNRLGQIKKPSQYPGSSNDARIVSMLRTLEKENYKGAFFIKRSRKVRGGIYRFKGGKKTLAGGQKVKNIQIVKDLSKSVASRKKRPWLTMASNKAVTASTTKRFFRKNAMRVTFGKRK